jgi:hypothetical protein
VDSGEAESYAGVGREFFKAADMARHHEYWNAAGLLYVHGAIALADAVCIARDGVKSTSENHMDAVALLGEVTSELKDRDEALGHLQKIIKEKNRAAYTGQSFRSSDVQSIGKHAERFVAWAGKLLRISG